jgi:hypothetical protein
MNIQKTLGNVLIEMAENINEGRIVIVEDINVTADFMSNRKASVGVTDL